MPPFSVVVLRLAVTGYSLANVVSIGTNVLSRLLAGGIAGAAVETGQISAAQAETWLEARRQAVSAEIGHLDLLALPPG